MQVDESLRDFERVFDDMTQIAGRPFYMRPFMGWRLRSGELLAKISSSTMMYTKVVKTSSEFKNGPVDWIFG